MAWIRIIQENEATGKFEELYDKLTEPWGGVDNIMKIHSLNPRSLWAHFELYTWPLRLCQSPGRWFRCRIRVMS